MFLFFGLLGYFYEYNEDDMNEFSPRYTFDVGPRIKGTLSRSPIRVVFDYTYLDDPSKDPYACKTVGQAISWNGYTYSCSQDDIINASSRQVIKDTYENLRVYLAQTLKVTPMASSFSLRNWTNLATIQQKLIQNADLHVTIVGRPFGASSTLASAGSLQSESSEYRPIQGFVFMNIKRIPKTAENEAYTPNRMFQLLFHEVLHVLGITQYQFDYWMDRNTLKRYTTFPKTLLYHGQKSFTIIHTPECHRYAKYRFGLETFTDGTNSCPAGVEFEDTGGSGTKGSHPEGRVYFNEAMVGVLQPNAIISDLSLALLYDTGWYDVSYQNAHGLGWGNGRSLTGTPLTSFPLGPPQTIFPSHYLCSNNFDSGRCTYDYKAIGVCSNQQFDCSNPTIDTDIAFCQTQSFYNPNGLTVRGSSVVHDHMLYIGGYSNRICTSNTSSLFYGTYGESFGDKSRCIMINNNQAYGCFQTRCDDLRLYLIVNGVEKECTSKDQELVFGSTRLKCPNPQHLCRLEQIEGYLPEDPFSSGEPKQTMAITPKASPAMTPMKSITQTAKQTLAYTPKVTFAPTPFPSPSNRPQTPNPSASKIPQTSNPTSSQQSPYPTISKQPQTPNPSNHPSLTPDIPILPSESSIEDLIATTPQATDKNNNQEGIEQKIMSLVMDYYIYLISGIGGIILIALFAKCIGSSNESEETTSSSVSSELYRSPFL